jgi:hypothetical protein
VITKNSKGWNTNGRWLTSIPEFLGLTQYEIDRRIDLGLSLLSLVARPGEPLTHEDIAAWCGCNRQKILHIETTALRKLRRRLRIVGDPLLKEMMEEYFQRRQPARGLNSDWRDA